MVERYSLNAKAPYIGADKQRFSQLQILTEKGSASCIQAPVKRRQLKRRKKEVSLRKNRKD